MSSMNERADDGVATRASEVSEEGREQQVARPMEAALQAFGQHSTNDAFGAAAARVRELASSDEEMHKLLAALAPKGVNPDLWSQWIGGGADPFHGLKLRRASIGAPTPAKSARLSSNRVRFAQEELSRAEARVVEAEQAAERARIDLDHMRAVDSVVMQGIVSEHLASLLQATFAMGPAWTIMRALSAYMSPSRIAEATCDLPNEVARRNAEERAVAMRQRRTNEMLDALDLWCGHEEFEEELRRAVLGVVRTFAERESERDVEGSKARGRATYKVSVRESARRASDAVIDGMKRPAAA